MSLPASWVDRIFAKLTLIHGQRFLGLYAGLDLAAVKAVWGKELAAYERRPDAIAWALDNLPADQVPTVLAFRELCRAAPQAPLQSLPAPKVDPAHLVAKASAINPPRPKLAGLDWAYDLARREQAGDPTVTFGQKRMWRNAFGVSEKARPETVLAMEPRAA